MKALTPALIGSSVLAVSMLGMPSQAATSGHSPAVHASRARGGDATARTPGYYDARQLQGSALVKADRQALDARTKADTSYYRSLGGDAVVDIDPLTKTPREVGRSDGYLSGPSSASARTVAMNYVRSHLAALGLTSADLSTFRFRQDYVDTIGIHHLSWTQSVQGATVFGNGLRVAVTRQGRVLSVQGSPVSGLAKLAAAAPAATEVTAAAARTSSARDVQGRVQTASVRSSRSGSSAGTVWSNNDFAKRVWFLTPQGLRPGWSTYVQSSAGAYQHVIDAVSGRVLYRHSNSDNASGRANVYDYYPGAPRGGKAKTVNLFKRGWLKKKASFLKGTSVTTWDDLNDDNAINKGEKTPVPGKGKRAQFKLHRFGSSPLCSRHFQCTWNPDKPFSWKKNRKEDAVQAFYLASNYHDYLAEAPIGFTRAAGNFSAAGHDPVHLNALDGANTADGLPDGNHIDNANMSTPPDGISPTMQMYLWHVPGLNAKDEPFVPTSSAFDASVEYHEYTHGLSNRLVIDANGNSTLNDIQAGAMGEAWSDYYAMDYLVTKGFVKDTRKSGEVFEGKYLMAAKSPFRTMAIDCAVGSKAKGCTSTFDGSKGGYTYGDFPSISGAPEVHASGEVWAQTLWDLRKAFGHRVADTLITRGMSLSADDPDMLDMRNAILRADLVKYNRAHTARIWKIFANRGMGFYAGSIDSADTTPGQDFHTPPPAKRPHDGVIAGTVTDPTSGDPVAGALVQVTGQGNQYTARTDADGTYAIGGLVTGRYAKVAASGPGYFPDAHAGRAVEQSGSSPTHPTDFSITRDWAATSGGATVTDFDGPDFSDFGCGPEGAFDTSLGSGWGSTTGDDNGTPTNHFIPKSITVQLPQPVDITTFEVDPSATCGDGQSASAGNVVIAVSTDGNTFDDVASDTYTEEGSDDSGLNTLTPSGPTDGIKFVRLTINSNQTPDFSTNCPNGAFSGCAFTDLTELAVLGTPSP
jgi:hypothetical protein